MNDRIGQHYLADIVRQLEKLRRLAEDAMRQVKDDQFFRTLDPESNSIALILKHVAGNMLDNRYENAETLNPHLRSPGSVILGIRMRDTLFKGIQAKVGDSHWK